MKKYFLLLSLFFILISNALLAQEYKPGSKVEIKWSNSWYKGSVLEVKDNQYKITYQGYSSTWDEWVGKDRLRPIVQTGTTNSNATTTAPATSETATTAKAAPKVTKPVNAGSYAKTSAGNLYLKTYFWTGPYGSSLNISWIFLGNDGTVVRDPKNGVNPIDYKAELTNNARNIGKYKKDGSAILVTWHNGTTSRWNTSSKNGEYATIDGGIVSRQKGMPANYRLNGMFSASTFLPGLSSVHKFTFRKDGTFALNRSGSIATSDVTGFSEDQLKGTYNISGNTLKLNYANGDKKVSTICIWDDGSKKNLVINGNYFPQQ